VPGERFSTKRPDTFAQTELRQPSKPLPVRQRTIHYRQLALLLKTHTYPTIPPSDPLVPIKMLVGFALAAYLVNAALSLTSTPLELSAATCSMSAMVISRQQADCLRSWSSTKFAIVLAVNLDLGFAVQEKERSRPGVRCVHAVRKRHLATSLENHFSLVQNHR